MERGHSKLRHTRTALLCRSLTDQICKSSSERIRGLAFNHKLTAQEDLKLLYHGKSRPGFTCMVSIWNVYYEYIRSGLVRPTRLHDAVVRYFQDSRYVVLCRGFTSSPFLVMTSSQNPNSSLAE